MYYEEEFYPADLVTFEPFYSKYSDIKVPKTIFEVYLYFVKINIIII